MRGVCIVALGYRIYGEMAANLAASLRAVSPDIQIALLYDQDGINTLTKEHLKLFTHLVEVGGSEITVTDSKHYQIAKLLVYKFSPFDFTIYIDADTIWGRKPIEGLFDQLKGVPFHVGTHAIYDTKKSKEDVAGYTYWCRPYEACIYHSLDYYQQTISGLFYFEKSDNAERIFNIAREVYFDPKTPNFIWANGKPDEYCFSVALAKLNVQIPRNSLLYFDKLHGNVSEQYLFDTHYGMAIGGHKITHTLKAIYNRLSSEAAGKFGLKFFPCIEKYVAIPTRTNKQEA